MGKRLKQQRRGKTRRHVYPKTRTNASVGYRSYDDTEKAGVLIGKVINFVDDPLHQAILMQIEFDNNDTIITPAPEGIAIGDTVYAGAQGKIRLGSILPLYRIPDGMYVYNLEKKPGDNGKFIRAPGSFGYVVSRDKKGVYIKLPSRRTIQISPDCRAQIGVVSGGGRLEKPLMKAGAAYYKNRKGLHKIWPRTRGVAMSPYNHPHGGKQHHVGKPTTVAKGTPPGGKVGHVGARSTGRRKSRRRVK